MSPIFVDFQRRVIITTTQAVAQGYSTPKLTTAEKFAKLKAELENRFGDQPPKHGVIFKQKLNRNSEGFDTYGNGCVHNSICQYVPTQAERSKWNRPFPFPCDLPTVFSWLETKKGQTLTLGVKSDPFMWMDSKYEVTKAVLIECNRLNIKLIIQTMSDLLAREDYRDLVAAGGHTVRMNMGFDKTQQVERITSPGAPSLKRREQAAAQLQALGVNVKRESQPLNGTAAKMLGFNSLLELQRHVNETMKQPKTY